MPFISTQKVAEIRAELKKKFPEFKMSVTCRHYIEMAVSLMRGPVDFGESYIQVNQYHIEDHFKGQASEILQAIYNIISKDCKEQSYSEDYGSIPSYYIHLTVGKWDKPYELIK